jgi:hypothetical protein
MTDFRQFKGVDGKTVYVNTQNVAALIAEGPDRTEIRFDGSSVFVLEPIEKVKNDLG